MSTYVKADILMYLEQTPGASTFLKKRTHQQHQRLVTSANGEFQGFARKQDRHFGHFLIFFLIDLSFLGGGNGR